LHYGKEFLGETQISTAEYLKYLRNINKFQRKIRKQVMQEIYYGFSYQIPMVIGQIKLPVNNGVIQVALSLVIPARDAGISFHFMMISSK
jgi:hypothetical protein